MEPVIYSSKLNLPPPAYGLSQDNDQVTQFIDNQIQLTQSTVITVEEEEPPVRDHLVWSIFNTVYMNFCCLGFLALVFSVKSRDRKNVGDKEGAMSYASTARGLNITTTVLSILTFIIQLVVVLLVVL